MLCRCDTPLLEKSLGSAPELALQQEFFHTVVNKEWIKNVITATANERRARVSRALRNGQVVVEGRQDVEGKRKEVHEPVRCRAPQTIEGAVSDGFLHLYHFSDYVAVVREKEKSDL